MGGKGCEGRVWVSLEMSVREKKKDFVSPELARDLFQSERLAYLHFYYFNNQMVGYLLGM